jgi:hypothetical protein
MFRKGCLSLLTAMLSESRLVWPRRDGLQMDTSELKGSIGQSSGVSNPGLGYGFGQRVTKGYIEPATCSRMCSLQSR